MSTKPFRSVHSSPTLSQKYVRKGDVSRSDSLVVDRLKTALAHLSGIRGNVAMYEQIAAELSKLAGKDWSWRYVASVCSGSVSPSAKFLRVVELYLQELSPRRKQWFYFVRRGAVAAVFDKSIMQEMIVSQMKSLGYRAVTFSRYKQVKKSVVKR